MIKTVSLFVLFLLFGCAGATPTPAVARATTRAAVDVAKDAWVMVAQGCADYADASKDATVVPKCAAYLTPAHDAIIVAAKAVDTTWSPTAACSLSQAADELLAAASTLGVVSASMGPLVNDAKTLAASILGSVVCAPAPAPVYLTVPGSGPADAGKDG